MTKRKDAPSAAVRIRAMKRDRFRCTYCGTPGTDAELEVDHIIAVANGGSHHISNLTTACRKCNQAKGDGPAPERRNPSGSMVGLFVHTHVADGCITYQGRIIGEDAEDYLVQLFSWLTGAPTNVQPFRKDFIKSKSCRLYADSSTWNAVADALDA